MKLFSTLRQFFSQYPLYLFELDAFSCRGKWYTLGHKIRFDSDGDIEDFVSHAREEEREFTIYPMLFMLLGGAVKKEIRKVYTLK